MFNGKQGVEHNKWKKIRELIRLLVKSQKERKKGCYILWAKSMSFQWKIGGPLLLRKINTLLIEPFELSGTPLRLLCHFDNWAGKKNQQSGRYFPLRVSCHSLRGSNLFIEERWFTNGNLITYEIWKLRFPRIRPFSLSRYNIPWPLVNLILKGCLWIVPGKRFACIHRISIFKP